MSLLMPNKVNWQEIYNTEYVNAPECWKTCGGYCCKNFYGEHFNILDKSGVSLPLLENEYEYYKSIGGIKNITTPAKKRTFTLSNGKSFSIYLLSCQCGGLCEPHGHRPLVCRIYPYFPIVDAFGTVIDFEYSALMDLFYRDPDNNHKCTLVREQAIKLKRELTVSMKPLLRDPEVVFIFRCLKELVDRLKEKMGGFIDTLDESQKKKFIAKYEWMILSGKPWKDPAFSKRIDTIYDEVKAAFGNEDFL
ncbi:MAG: Fe-S-cluster containining protein [Pseudoalteromonas rhizosphaerae]